MEAVTSSSTPTSPVMGSTPPTAATDEENKKVAAMQHVIESAMDTLNQGAAAAPSQESTPRSKANVAITKSSVTSWSTPRVRPRGASNNRGATPNSTTRNYGGGGASSSNSAVNDSTAIINVDGAVAPDSTTPWVSGSPYKSPRRRIVPGGTLHAATLLDSARNTVALLTEEVVSLRRENAQLTKKVAGCEQTTTTVHRLHGQVAMLKKELDTLKVEHVAVTSRDGDLQKQVASLTKRMDDLLAKDRKATREKRMADKTIEALRDELNVVKLVSKQTIDTLLGYLEGGNAQE